MQNGPFLCMMYILFLENANCHCHLSLLECNFWRFFTHTLHDPPSHHPPTFAHFPRENPWKTSGTGLAGAGEVTVAVKCRRVDTLTPQLSTDHPLPRLKKPTEEMTQVTVTRGCRFVPSRLLETKPQMVPRDLNIGFQGLALIQGQIYIVCYSLEWPKRTLYLTVFWSKGCPWGMIFQKASMNLVNSLHESIRFETKNDPSRRCVEAKTCRECRCLSVLLVQQLWFSSILSSTKDFLLEIFAQLVVVVR